MAASPHPSATLPVLAAVIVLAADWDGDGQAYVIPIGPHLG